MFFLGRQCTCSNSYFPKFLLISFFTVLILLISTLSLGNSWAAITLSLDYDKKFGGKLTDRGFTTLQTEDDGFVVLGETYSHYLHGSGEFDTYLVKFDQNGYQKWQKTYGKHYDDKAFCVQQTSDRGYILAGETQSYTWENTKQMWVVKTDSEGLLKWVKSFGEKGESAAASITETADGGYLVAGETNSKGAGHFDVYLVKLDSSGKTVWEKTFGGKYNDRAKLVIQTTDGGYLIVGQTNSYGSGNYDIYLLKVTAKGSLEWEKTMGGYNFDEINSILETGDGSFVLAGYTNSFSDGKTEALLTKLDNKGNILWAQLYNKDIWSIAKNVQRAGDQGYLLGGWTANKNGNYDFYLVKTDLQGNKIWEKTIEDSRFNENFAISPVKEGYMITGWWTDSMEWNRIYHRDEAQILLLKVKVEEK